MDGIDRAKTNAAKHAYNLIHPRHRIIGIGTGSTVEKLIEILGANNEFFRDRFFVASSLDTALKLRRYGFKVLSTSMVDEVDIYIDGADEVDRDMNMIKGGGAAHVLEKILAYYSKERIYIVDYTKIVDFLGQKHPIPIEVLPEALYLVYNRLSRLGYNVKIRLSSKGKYGVVISDTRGVIIDLYLDEPTDVVALENTLRSIPGVVGTGLFIGLADKIIVGYPDHVEVMDRHHIQ